MKSHLTVAALLLVVLGVAAPALAAKKLNNGGTYIHVKNSTNKTLEFDLYVECTNEGTGKFDNRLTLQPGEVAVWKLSAGHNVAVQQKDGKSFYRVGLVGKDLETGKNHQWGVVGSDGMLGRERTSETETDAYRNILVQPIGKL